MISREVCQRVLRKAVSTGADYAEIFAENTINHNINIWMKFFISVSLGRKRECIR